MSGVFSFIPFWCLCQKSSLFLFNKLSFFNTSLEWFPLAAQIFLAQWGNSSPHKSHELRYSLHSVILWHRDGFQTHVSCVFCIAGRFFIIWAIAAAAAAKSHQSAIGEAPTIYEMHAYWKLSPLAYNGEKCLWNTFLGTKISNKI